jgi:LytS/YehU family sensor histidine kinase
LTAGVSLVLALALITPQWLGCWWNAGADACLSGRGPSIAGLFASAFLLWALLALAGWSQRWLPRDPERRTLGLVWQIGALTLGSLLFFSLLNHGDVSPYTLQIHLTLAAGACLFVEYRERARRGLADAQLLELNEQTLARQMDAARAQLLQAQIEPHFLFNTLAHLRRLARTDVAGARAMLADLLRYLEAALPSLRSANSVLSRELELVSAFLALHQRRIGTERLRLRMDVAPGLEAIVVPSTCLLTLAENAIKHGITPQVEGGEIAVTAKADPDDPQRLLLELADTGVGMGSSSGSGTGLATLRARLAGAYGPAASLSMRLNTPQGLVVQLRLPLSPP